MRKSILLSFFICLLFSCSKDKLTVTFDLFQNATFSFQPSPLPTGLVNLPLISVTPNWTSTFSANNTDVNQLKSLHAKNITLKVTNPSGQSLHFLKSIIIYISANGQSETQLAYKNPVPDNVGTSMSLDLPNVDIAPYVKQNQFNIRVSFEQRDAVTQQVDMEADMDFTAVAYLLK